VVRLSDGPVAMEAAVAPAVALAVMLEQMLETMEAEADGQVKRRRR